MAHTQQPCKWLRNMMTSSNGNIFRVTGPLCGEFTGKFLAQRPVTRSFDVFADLHLNNGWSTQWWGWWFQTPVCPLWRHCNYPSCYRSSRFPNTKLDLFPNCSFIHFWSINLPLILTNCHLLRWIGLVLACVGKMWKEIWEWIRNFTPHFTGYVIIHPCLPDTNTALWDTHVWTFYRLWKVDTVVYFIDSQPKCQGMYF